MSPVNPRPRLPATVFALGCVSFCTDLSSEMILPLLPAFLASLGGSQLQLGMLQGVGELVVSLLKVASGWLSDRQRARKPWMVVGYTLSSVLRPLVALVQAPWQAVVVRAGDRIGKGLRSAPRDALLTDVVDAAQRGQAFGLQRAMDHAGAIGGSLAAVALLLGGCELRTVFALAAVPGAIAVLVLLLAVRERPAAAATAAAPHDPQQAGRRLVPFLGVVVFGTIGSSVDLFVLVRASELGVPLVQLPLLWAVLHVVRAALSSPLGTLSDRLGRRRVIGAGLFVHALVMLLFAAMTVAAWLWPAFALHGLHAAFTEGAERGFVADLTGAHRRGTVFGIYHGVQGVAAFVGSMLLGGVWDAAGAGVAFTVAAAAALVALVVLVVAVPRHRP